ncbi:MAG: oligosaccharide flippase family protein [Bacteroidota bacterium]
MRKIFAANLIFLLLLNGVIKPLWIFAIDRNVQIVLGAQEYGFYFALFNFSLLFNFLLDLGITNFNNREISYHPQMVSQQFSNIVVIKLVLAIIYSVVTVGLALALGFGSRHIALLAVLTLNQFLASFLLFVRSNLNGLQLFKADSILSVMDKVFVIVLVSLLLWGNLNFRFTVEVFALTQTISYIITIVIAFWLLKGKYRVTIHPQFDRFTIADLIKKGFPFAVLVLLMTLYSRLDTVLVERLSPNGAVSAGVYAQAFRLFDAFNMYSYLFAALMLPIFARMMSNHEDIREIFNFSVHLLIIPVIAISVPTMIYNYPVMSILYHEHIDISAKALVFLMGSFIFVAFAYLFGTALTAMGKIWLLCRISLFVVIFGLLSIVILIPRFGVLGAAVANLIANALAALLQGYFFIRNQKGVIGRSSALRISLYVFMYFLLGLIFRCTVGNNLLGFLISVASSLIIIFGLRLLTFKAVYSFVKGI